MNQATAFLEIEQDSEMLIIRPVMELQELDEIEMEEMSGDLWDHMDHAGVADVYLDLHGTNILDSEAPWLSVELWKRVRSHGGSMAICLI